MRKSVILLTNPRPDESPYLSINRAETLVYRGDAAFFEDPSDGVRKIRYLESHERMRLQAEYQEYREKQFDNAMIESGRGVVFWNGSSDPKSRHVPGMVRS